MHLEPTLHEVTKTQLLEWEEIHRQLPDLVLEKLLGRFGTTALTEFKFKPCISRGAFARASGISIHAVRHYTQEGLLPVLRFNTKFLYPYTALETTREILKMRGLGMSLADIKNRLLEIYKFKQEKFAAVARAVGQDAPDINDPKQRKAFRLEYMQIQNDPELRRILEQDPVFELASLKREAFKTALRAKLEQEQKVIEEKLLELAKWK